MMTRLPDEVNKISNKTLKKFNSEVKEVISKVFNETSYIGLIPNTSYRLKDAAVSILVINYHNYHRIILHDETALN